MDKNWQEKRDEQIEGEVDHMLILKANNWDFKRDEMIEDEVNEMLCEK